MWDVTVADTTTVSYLAATATVTRSAAKSAAVRKEMKFAELSYRYPTYFLSQSNHMDL